MSLGHNIVTATTEDLDTNKDKVEKIAKLLLEKEALSADEISEIIGNGKAKKKTIKKKEKKKTTDQ